VLALSVTISQHLAKEEDLVVPLLEARLSEAEIGSMSRDLVVTAEHHR
jgi:iron-sulfur cluster repair protein YtfE (RIC family)